MNSDFRRPQQVPTQTPQQMAAIHRQQMKTKVARRYPAILNALIEFSTISPRPKGYISATIGTHSAHRRRSWGRSNLHVDVGWISHIYPLEIKSSASEIALWFDPTSPHNLVVLERLRCEKCRQPGNYMYQMVDLKEYMEKSIHTDLELQMFTRSLLGSLEKIAKN